VSGLAKFHKDKVPFSAHYAIMAKDNQKLVSKNNSCLFAEAGCIDKPIRSHSIQDASLRKISDSTNHVYSFESPNYVELENIHKNAIYHPEKVGVANATVFYGFCSMHDTELFHCIEKEEIEPNISQLNALYFRPIARSLHFNNGLKKVMKNIKEYDYPDNHKPKENLLYIAKQELSLDEALLQMSSDKAMVGKNLLSSSPNKDSYLFLRLKSIPDVMFSSLLAPTFDLHGVELLDEYIPEDIQSLCVTISSDIVGGYAMLQWSKKDRFINSFVDSFIKSNYDWNKLVAYLMIFNDFVFSPDWWDDLSETQKEIIMHFAMAPHFTHLLKDIFVSFKVYKHFLKKDIEFVNWEVVETKSNA
jgi:hypothetical protein